MKGFLLGCASAVLISGAALAADLPVKGPVYKAPPAYDWSGFYAGAHIGYGWGHEHDNLSKLIRGAPIDRFDIDGIIGGVHAGYNWQANHFVYGFEADFDGSGMKGSAAFDNPATFGTLTFKNDWQASLRARAGYAADNWLLYATGGIAFAGAKSKLDIIDKGTLVPVHSSASKTLTGWTIGVGSEYAFSKNWITRAEVRYTDFGTGTFHLTDSDEDPAATRVRFDEILATVGISYKF